MNATLSRYIGIFFFLGVMLTACGGGGSGGASGISGSSGGLGNSAGGNNANYSGDSENLVDDPNPDQCLEDRCFYFSYDDSASTASVEIVKYAILNDQFPDASLGRAYEFLNYESFNSDLLSNIGLFDVSMGIWEFPGVNPENPTIYELGIQVTSPTITLEERQNMVLTLLVDVSGSMSSNYLNVRLEQEGTIQSRLDVAKYGLEQLHLHSMKEGDILNIVQFSTSSTEADVLLEGWPYTVDDPTFVNTVSSMRTINTTNLDEGIQRAYNVATRNFDQTKINRVIILTDAFANTGETDVTVISGHTSINNQEGIYFSGLGIGAGFNEGFLDELTDAGKGGYMSVITPNDARNAFNNRFIGLLNVAAKNTQFRLDFPNTLQHISTASEELSSNQSEVQTTNFSYNTSQYFLESFSETDIATNSDAEFLLTITYEDDEGNSQTETLSGALAELIGVDEENIKDAHLVTFLARLVSGDNSCADYDELVNGLLVDHVSDLATEYRELIERHCLNLGEEVNAPVVN